MKKIDLNIYERLGLLGHIPKSVPAINVEATVNMRKQISFSEEEIEKVNLRNRCARVEKLKDGDKVVDKIVAYDEFRVDQPVPPGYIFARTLWDEDKDFEKPILFENSEYELFKKYMGLDSEDVKWSVDDRTIILLKKIKDPIEVNPKDLIEGNKKEKGKDNA